jgi:hypothetical protein
MSKMDKIETFAHGMALRRYIRGPLGVGAALLLLIVAAGPAAATPGTPVRITSSVVVGPFTGTWSAVGGIADSGTLVEPRVNFVGNGELHINRLVTATAGTFTLRIDSKAIFEQDGSVDFSGRWVVIAGTGMYAGLRGEGTRAAQIAADSDVVVETLTGSVHFD